MTELLVGFHRDVISCELARQGVRSPAPLRHALDLTSIFDQEQFCSL